MESGTELTEATETPPIGKSRLIIGGALFVGSGTHLPLTHQLMPDALMFHELSTRHSRDGELPSSRLVRNSDSRRREGTIEGDG